MHNLNYRYYAIIAFHCSIFYIIYYMKISFIIPIYKVEEIYLQKLIVSLNNQKHHKMFECIFIIDEINPIVNYTKIISNLNTTISFQIIRNKTNLGSGESRNIGIDNSNGEYVAFIDSDDYISDDFLEKIILFFNSQESDLIRINYTDNECREWMSTITNYKNFKNTIIPGWASFTMILKKDFLNKHDIRFPKGYSYAEDIYIFILIMCNLERWYEINDKTYHYNREVRNSITTKMHKNYIKSYLTIKEIIRLTKTKMKTKIQNKKFRFYKKYIFGRLLKNMIYTFLRLDRSNI